MDDAAQPRAGKDDLETSRFDGFIDDAGRDSFPASDPPPWTLGVRHEDDPDAAPDEHPVEES